MGTIARWQPVILYPKSSSGSWLRASPVSDPLIPTHTPVSVPRRVDGSKPMKILEGRLQQTLKRQTGKVPGSMLVPGHEILLGVPFWQALPITCFNCRSIKSYYRAHQNSGSGFWPEYMCPETAFQLSWALLQSRPPD